MATNTKTNKTKLNTTADKTIAVVSLGGKQFLVKVGDIIQTELVVDKKIQADDLLHGKKVELETDQAIVKGEKLNIWKFKNKTRYLKRLGHRQKYSTLKVISIK